jgi:hypothetical protein
MSADHVDNGIPGVSGARGCQSCRRYPSRGGNGSSHGRSSDDCCLRYTTPGRRSRRLRGNRVVGVVVRAAAFVPGERVVQLWLLLDSHVDGCVDCCGWGPHGLGERAA